MICFASRHGQSTKK